VKETRPGQALEAGGTEKEAGPLGRRPGPVQWPDAGTRGRPSSDTARSNGPNEVRRHTDSGEEVELVMCNEEP